MTTHTALQITTQALKDIINAASNGSPYSSKELEEQFMDAYTLGCGELQSQGLDEIA